MSIVNVTMAVANYFLSDLMSEILSHRDTERAVEILSLLNAVVNDLSQNYGYSKDLIFLKSAILNTIVLYCEKVILLQDSMLQQRLHLIESVFVQFPEFLTLSDINNIWWSILESLAAVINNQNSHSSNNGHLQTISMLFLSYVLYKSHKRKKYTNDFFFSCLKFLLCRFFEHFYFIFFFRYHIFNA